MTELLKNGGGNSAENAGASLTEMSGKFDPNKAQDLIRQNEPERAGKPNGEVNIEGDVGPWTTALEKREEELSPKDAANEYLALLDELSQDFTYPFYKDFREGEQHYANNITTELGRKYSDNPHYRWKGYLGTEAGTDDGTMVRIASADCIIANEIGWRVEGKKVGEGKKQIDELIADLDADYSKKSGLGKFFGGRKYKKARKRLEGYKKDTEIRFNWGGYNRAIARELAISYNEKGDYDWNGGDRGGSNEARNRRFFGLDDPERAKKVERAIELRQKYEAEWAKRK